MDLATFVRLTMKEKNLSNVDIERNSDNMITDTYVATVLAGNAPNPTVRVLMGLAKGLDVHPIELFKAAASVEEPTDSWTPETLLMAYQRMLHLKPGDIKQIKRILKIK